MSLLEHAETLVLGCGFEPLARVHWQRAMGMWVAGRVEIVEPYEGAWIRTVSCTYPLPSVVRFSSMTAWRRLTVGLSRESVFLRDGGRCQYCGAEMSRARATWDHVVPRCRGGHTRWDNVVLACRTCNQKKGGKTPEEAGMKLHCRPTKPNGLGSLLDSSLSYREPMPSHWRTYLG